MSDFPLLSLVTFLPLIVLYAWLAPGRGTGIWGTGGGGDAIGVTLVATVPLPASPRLRSRNVRRRAHCLCVVHQP